MTYDDRDICILYSRTILYSVQTDMRHVVMYMYYILHKKSIR